MLDRAGQAERDRKAALRIGQQVPRRQAVRRLLQNGAQAGHGLRRAQNRCLRARIAQQDLTHDLPFLERLLQDRLPFDGREGRGFLEGGNAKNRGPAEGVGSIHQQGVHQGPLVLGGNGNDLRSAIGGTAHLRRDATNRLHGAVLIHVACDRKGRVPGLAGDDGLDQQGAGDGGRRAVLAGVLVLEGDDQIVVDGQATMARLDKTFHGLQGGRHGFPDALGEFQSPIPRHHGQGQAIGRAGLLAGGKLLDEQALDLGLVAPDRQHSVRSRTAAGTPRAAIPGHGRRRTRLIAQHVLPKAHDVVRQSKTGRGRQPLLDFQGQG